MKLYSFGKRINRYQAADIIGSFFPSISDRLKNTLQLNDDLETNIGNVELIRASVLQRSNSLSAMPFVSAVDFKENRKYVKYLIPIFLVLVVVGVAAPSLFTQGTERVINYTKQFKLVAPFKFVLVTEDLVIEEGKDLDVVLEVSGKELPEVVYLISENGKFLMKRKAKNSFIGTIKKPNGSGTFFFQANEFESDKYSLSVLEKLQLVNWKLNCFIQNT